MSKQRHTYKGKAEFKGLAGWEIKYLKQSIKFGHLDAGTTSTKQQYKYNKGK